MSEKYHCEPHGPITGNGGSEIKAASLGGAHSLLPWLFLCPYSTCLSAHACPRQTHSFSGTCWCSHGFTCHGVDFANFTYAFLAQTHQESTNYCIFVIKPSGETIGSPLVIGWPVWMGRAKPRETHVAPWDCPFSRAGKSPRCRSSGEVECAQHANRIPGNDLKNQLPTLPVTWSSFRLTFVLWFSWVFMQTT